MTRECFLFLALLAVFTRALIPVGVMPSFAHGQAQLVICYAGTSGPADHDTATEGSAGHHHAGASGNACPYALSGGAAPLPEMPAPSIAYVVPEFKFGAIATAPRLESLPRYTAPRGPPQA